MSVSRIFAGDGSQTGRHMTDMTEQRRTHLHHAGNRLVGPLRRTALAYLTLAFSLASGPAIWADSARVVEPMPSLAPLLEQVTPAVVNISTRGAVPRNPLMDDPFFRRYFGFDDSPREAPLQSLGSGVVVDAERGLVVTNHHVIENATQILVTLSDAREFDASVVGTDPEADIAVIEIAPDGLTALPWADSSALQVGDYCIAIGNPFGLGQTVTSGIVSALGRSGLGIESFEDFIQTDASINPGNSGGALVNLRGELIGINTAIVGPGGGNVGIGFAIPSNMAADLTAQILEYGEVRRGALGIAVQPLTPELADAFGVSSRYGVIIGRLQENSPAEQGGLLAGDVITRIDNRRITDIGALRNRIGLVRLGQELKVDLVRDGQAMTLMVSVGELPEINPLLKEATLLEKRSRNGRQFVVVEEIVPGSQLEQVGLQPGDIVLSINRQGVGTIRDIKAIGESAGSELLVLIQRGRSTSYVRLNKG
ncbi:MAG: Do family serine endopeptidase [Granulosicoccus sp.]